MTVKRMDIGRIPFIGAFSFCTDKFSVFPMGISFDEGMVESLGVPLMKMSVSASPLLGIFLAGNSKRVICSDAFRVEDGSDLNVDYISGKFTALGNLILANDHGAIVSPDFPDATIEVISDRLKVPVERGTVANFKNVGAVGVATNNGALLHPNVTEGEIEHVQRVLKVPVDVGTACSGLGFLGICVVANSNGALVGTTTTGPELGRIESSLGFLR